MLFMTQTQATVDIHQRPWPLHDRYVTPERELFPAVTRRFRN
jgi:hypothetical protein